MKSKNYFEHDKKGELRVNKFISDTGYCSRRAADKLIETRKVTINGKVATLGSKVLEGDTVKVNGKNISANKKDLVYIALNKPKGVICTTDRTIEGNLTDFMRYPEIIFPIGRLDKDSTGLLLLTNDGDIVNKILREEYGHDKEYIVTVDKPINNNFLAAMENGVKIYNPVSDSFQITNKCMVKKINECRFSITLNQGLNRQIRRMTEKLNYNVVSLKRVRIINIKLGNLKLGAWRYLTQDEMKILSRKLEGKKNLRD